ncbi:MAG: STAS domain-containing protein [Candidatus Eremiobacteraeota bacterium]|nr:STAS domain-containing protein [Candidatus Eremiobacteraeota bacterium]
MSLSVVSYEKSPGVFVVAPEGIIDASTYEAFEKKVESALENKPGILIMDLDKLNYISSIGLRVIAKAKKHLKQTGGTVMMVNLQPQIKEVFEIIKALPKEQIFSSIAELDDYLLTMQRKSVEERKA